MKEKASSTRDSLLLTAQALLKSGISVIPVNSKTKTPIGQWKEYQTSKIKKEKLRQAMNDSQNSPGIAVIGGKVSGNLEVIDFDHDLQYFNAFKKIVREANPNLWAKLYIEQTQSGFRHIAYRCSSAKSIPTAKLAYARIKVKTSSKGNKVTRKGKTYPVQKIDGKKYITPVIIETRGERGYCICAPSPGYKTVQGSLSALPDITKKERDYLLNVAKSLTEWVKSADIEMGEKIKPSASSGERPGDFFNEKGDPRQFLIKHGWQPLPKSNSKFEHFTRPGKKEGVSGSLIDGKIFSCFSTNAAPFAAGKSYAPLAVFALLEHGEDYKAAVKDLVRQGYVGDSPSPKGLASTGELPKPVMTNVQDKPPIFPLDALPKTMRDYVNVRSRQFSVAHDYIAVPLLISIAGFIGKTPHLRPFSNNPWSVRACAWGMVIGTPGDRKSPALTEATRILRGVDLELEDQYKKDMEFWEEQNKDRQQKEANEIYDVKNDYDCDEEADVDDDMEDDCDDDEEADVDNEKDDCDDDMEDDCDDDMEDDCDFDEEADVDDDDESDLTKPVRKRLVVADTTVEKLASIMEKSPGLTLIRDELAGFLRGINKYTKGGDEAFYLQCWSGGDFRTDRMKREGESIKDVYLNIVGTIQPCVITDLMNPGQEGMIERFSLMAYSPQPKWTYFDGDIREDLDHSIREIGMKLLEPEWRSKLEKYNETPFIPLTEKAESIWIKWMTKHDNVVQQIKEKKIGGLYAKMSGNILSLALILHLFKWADGETAKLEVGTKSLKSAITLYEDFFVPIWHRVFNELESSPFDQHVNQVKKYIQRRKLSEIKAREIQAQKIGTLYRVQDVEEVFDFLMEQHWLLGFENRQHPKGGPKSKVYIINPRVHEAKK